MAGNRNKYYQLLNQIVWDGHDQTGNKKGNLRYLLNVKLPFTRLELDELLAIYPIPKQKLADELHLYMRGEIEVSAYEDRNIGWWDYCAPSLVNSYPTYFKALPALIAKINRELRPSKNYMFYIGSTDVVVQGTSSQLPCLSLMQFQLMPNSRGSKLLSLHITVYQRSADCNLGLPCDLYQVKLIADMIDVPLATVTFFIGNAHIYENNLADTERMLAGEPNTKFKLNT